MSKTLVRLKAIANAAAAWPAAQRLERVRVPNQRLLPFILIPTFAIQRRTNYLPKKERRTGPLFRSVPFEATAKPLSVFDREDPRYLFYREVFDLDLPLDQTTWFTAHMQRVERGASRTMRSRGEILDFLNERRCLYEAIRAAMHVVSSYERTGAHGDEIGCVLGEGGEIIKGGGGNNRFAIARHLGIQMVPVQIDIIHAAHVAHVCQLPGRRPTEKINAFLLDLQRQHLNVAERSVGSADGG